ncbi:MAG: CvpA family protein [Aeoliella sp.]
MQTYDMLMLLVLVGATLFGFVKGMAWQVAYVASLVVSYFAALNFSSRLAPVFGDTEPFNRFVAMLAIYIATSFAIWMVFRVVSGAIDRVKLKEFDRQMGALIGFARGVLWCVAITFFASTLLESYRPAILGSRSGHYIALLLDKTHSFVPDEIHEVIHPYVERIEQGLDPNRPAESPWPSNEQGGEWPQLGGSQQPMGTSQPPVTQSPAGNRPAPWPQQNAGPTPWPQQPNTAVPWPDGNRVPAQPVGDGRY